MERPLGLPVPGWTPRPRPAPDLILDGRTCRLEPLDADRHASALHAAYGDRDELWTYMPQGPFPGADAYAEWAREVEHREDPFFLAILSGATRRPLGVASYLRVDPEAGSVEVGWITYAPGLQRTTAATEAMALMMRHAFDDLGYRRYEWKCDALNAASRAAAQRLGFTFEGVHRQARVVKGRNRDTAWFSILDREWPALRSELDRWLAPENFDADGRQLTPLRGPRPPGSPRPRGSAPG